jgi:4-amino-4-deoxy-L-arabinose transferase-like glycosyltransferase
VFSYIERQPGHAAAWLIAGFSLLHLLVIGIPELTNDEAQYALYGYYLDWSYFDHPPMVGWLNALILPFSDGDFALRLWPVSLSALSSVLLYGLTRDVYPTAPTWLATLSVLIFQSGLMFQVLGMAMLPDTPLIPISIASGWALLRAFRDDWKWGWLVIGLLLGLAGLSKYTAVSLVVTAILGLLIFRKQKSLLTPWPWLAVVVATLVILPVIYWNANHDWISIQYQLGHGMPQKSWKVSRFLLSQAGQFFAYAPGIFVFGYLATLTVLRRGSTQERFILALALPVLLLFGWNSGYEASLLHWTAVGWAALTPLISHGLYQHWGSTLVRVSAYFSLGYSIIIILILHSLLAFLHLTNIH